jgi:hypothetical protein
MYLIFIFIFIYTISQFRSNKNGQSFLNAKDNNNNDNSELKCEEFFRLVSVKRPDFELALTNIIVKKDDPAFVDEDFCVLGLRRMKPLQSGAVIENSAQVLFSLKMTPLKYEEVIHKIS